LISYLTPPIMQAGLYKGLIDLKDSLDRLAAASPGAEHASLLSLVRSQAAALNFADMDVARISARVLELEQTLIPAGLHTIGAPPSVDERIDLLVAMSDGGETAAPSRAGSRSTRVARPSSSTTAARARTGAATRTKRTPRTWPPSPSISAGARW